ncbi:uncharacterized protein E0L32_007159 [Thyridium curvatum]|uniref:DRBM domain-containing protein n=1 Tax=Thyridium curvatum TaxID=1093900 RepID=A0A507B014_9PEZI|nr:uncharacterized protein E0L32_007159 [Thyridium curvatum]TPX12044.1 hypothetical protein E0L32_007159 [Thyridium curvatum]
MASPASPGPIPTHCAIEPDPVNYEDLTSWIAAEKGVTSVPEALTKGQRKALATSKLPPLEEPVIGDTDWISLLMRYRDAHKDKQGIAFTEAPCPSPLNPGAPPHWTCCVTISEAPGSSFPPGPRGAGETQTQTLPPLPSFQRKKDAKQYAAKIAVTWLMEQGRMPTNAVDACFPKIKPAAAAKPAPAPVKARPAPSPSPSTSSSSQTRGENSAAARVAQLCHQLNVPLPRYVVIAHDRVPGWFSGYADFGGDMRIPPQIGRVEDVYGRKAAKEQMAEQVLQYLLEVEAERKRLVETVTEKLIDV